METTHINHPIRTIFIIFLLVFGFISTFFTGFTFHKLLSDEHIRTPNSQITPPPNPQISDRIEPTTASKNEVEYYDDTIIMLTKKKPYKAIVASTTRKQFDKGFQHNTRISYFNGTQWQRHTTNNVSSASSIQPNDLIKNWVITIDPTRVLKQSAQVALNVSADTITFNTGTIENEIATRSLPGYTKFMSKGDTTVNINGSSEQVYLLYTRIYSINSADIQFYDNPLGVTTDWLVFWDSQGNMHHIDATQVTRPTNIYQTHQIGVYDDSLGNVSKTFTISVERDKNVPPDTLGFTLGSPILQKIKVQRIESIDKAPDSTDSWYLSIVEGTVETNNGTVIPGIGISEYIKD